MEDLARSLRAEATRANERRLLVLAGDRDATVTAARSALSAADISLADTTFLSHHTDLDCERISPKRASALLGTTRTTVVIDAHDAFRPNVLGRSVGAVEGGGLVLILTPPLDQWPHERDEFDEGLAVPPFSLEDVTGNFRTRTVDLLRTHPGVAIYDVDAGRVEKDGLTDPLPARPPETPTPPKTHRFPAEAYTRCLTTDQAETVEAFERLADPETAIVVEADRGRGKSSAAGLAAGSLAHAGDDVLVTAPVYQNAAEVFARARELLDSLGALETVNHPDNPSLLTTTTGRRIRFEKPTTAAELPDDQNVVIVDEAAALPVRVLERFLAASRVAFTTTVHGYEGTGRGFSVRFRDRLDASDHDVTDVRLDAPIRYAACDPVEIWAFRTLLLDARPAVDPLVETASPELATYESPTPETLREDEHLLREVFGLLVYAHYRTEPDDLARLLDAPNLELRTLTHDGHVVCVALLAREGNLPASLRAEMYEGGRVRGNMLPDVLTSQVRDESAGTTAGLRVMRIATHPAVRSRGLGSRLLADIRAEFDEQLDWLGVGYGATPELLSFWRQNGYHTVYLSTGRNDASGEHSAVMMLPLSGAGTALHDRHVRWFVARTRDMLSDALSGLDPDVVRAALRATDADVELTLSAREWRLITGAAFGPGIAEIAPTSVRKLAMKHLTDHDDETLLTDRQERLLVRKVLQATHWRTVTEEFGFHSPAHAMRELSATLRPLVETYGSPVVATERRRFE
ncbi:tRNA(Met) cytidine acetyltransferase TmcA [Haladaptatus sp. DYSN1]|uniref:tRNA(Met) cytidine acetyltransferase TmcA n=1 Tax=unclassified Haladaptatus TaxID=2622732 RepID=UPI0024070F48|nr:tRNA(Met) cytidine acetyltransferase TmcA [Haladaptatus sp. DYSN1]